MRKRQQQNKKDFLLTFSLFKIDLKRGRSYLESFNEVIKEEGRKIRRWYPEFGKKIIPCIKINNENNNFVGFVKEEEVIEEGFIYILCNVEERTLPVNSFVVPFLIHFFKFKECKIRRLELQKVESISEVIDTMPQITQLSVSFSKNWEEKIHQNNFKAIHICDLTFSFPPSTDLSNSSIGEYLGSFKVPTLSIHVKKKKKTKKKKKEVLIYLTFLFN